MEKSKACRTCFTILGDSSSVSLSDSCYWNGFTCIGDVLEHFLSEMDLDIIQNPAMCNTCWLSLKKAYDLREQWLKNEKLLVKYVQDFEKPVSCENIVKVAGYINGISASPNTIIIKNEHTTPHLEPAPGSPVSDTKSEIHSDTEQPANLSNCSSDDDDDNSADESFPGFKPSDIEKSTRDMQLFNSNSRLRAKPRKNKNGPRSCHLCGKVFTLKRSLDTHLRAHAGLKPHTCEICGKRFSQSGHLNLHLRRHKGERPYQCDICGKCYTRGTQLKLHLLGHSGDKSRHCDICGKPFSHTSDLRKHKLTHTGEKPFTCETCGKTFSQNSYLNTHRQIHSDKKNYRCDICDKSFSHRSTLNMHMHNHRGSLPHQCEVCYKTFSYACLLKRHMIAHTAERRHKCDVCGKCFNRSAVLKQHLQIHTGEKLYRCEICGKSFSQNSSRRRHLKTHSAGDLQYVGKDLENAENGLNHVQEKSIQNVI